MGAVIRPAVPADASRLAEIQIFAKRTAFRSVFQNYAVSFNEMQVLEKNPAARSRTAAAAFPQTDPENSRRGRRNIFCSIQKSFSSHPSAGSGRTTSRRANFPSSKS